MFKKDIKTVLWENVQALMLAEYKKENLGQFAKKCGIGAASMTRIKKRDTGVMITTGEPIASGESYRNKADCLHAIGLIQQTNHMTPIFEVTI